jgi:hypothetical protein
MNCILFLTHHFKEEFLNTLLKLDKDKEAEKYDIFVLFDNQNNYDTNIDTKFQNIKIVKINRIETTYDYLGHSMYIHYFKQNYESIQRYKYIWIIENDVYYPDSIMHFINKHNPYDYDLMVSEYGTRDTDWYWTQTLKGFKTPQNIGVLAVIMRFSQDFMYTLIDTIDNAHYGYIESILPNLCLEYKLSIHQFLPELCGVLTTDGNSPLIKLIEMDIQNKTTNFIERKIYHPIKL